MPSPLGARKWDAHATATPKQPFATSKAAAIRAALLVCRSRIDRRGESPSDSNINARFQPPKAYRLHRHVSTRGYLLEFAGFIHSRPAAATRLPRFQSNRLETDSSAAVRAIASPMRAATDRVRMLRPCLTASVGWIESVMTSSLSREPVMRATAPPDSTPWVM